MEELNGPIAEWLSGIGWSQVHIDWTTKIIILAGIREKMAYNDIPKPFRGMPIVMVTAGLMAIAFCGFSGLL